VYTPKELPPSRKINKKAQYTRRKRKRGNRIEALVRYPDEKI